MNEAVAGIVSVAIAIVGVAIIATLVSKQAQTPQVIQAASEGFGSAIRSAVSPLSSGGGFTQAQYPS